MVSFPIQQKGKNKKRSKPYLMITHRPAEKSYNVVSAYAGYKLAKGKKPSIIIATKDSDKKFELFAEGETAWAPSDEVDEELAKMITRTGKELTFKGETFKGTRITDKYSLKGSLAAYKLICQECEVKP